MFPKQLNKLKIRSKLVFFLVIPIITLLYFSISSIHLKYQEHARTQASLDSILVSLSLSDLVHELQKERGLSAGFVGSAGTLHKKALLEQRKSTDEKLTLFTQHLTTHDPDHASWNLRTLFSHLQKKLKQLISIGTEIDAFKKNDFFYKYSAINTMALDICMHL